jgi:hypothetical protein
LWGRGRGKGEEGALSGRGRGEVKEPLPWRRLRRREIENGYRDP